jgi:hypothetical protein
LRALPANFLQSRPKIDFCRVDRINLENEKDDNR